MTSLDAPARRASTKAEGAYLELRRNIANGTLPPGYVLEQEQLARSLNMSTTPLREALRRLESEQFVELSPHREARVRPLLRTEMRDLYGVRIVLEPYAARLAAVKATESDFDALDAEVEARPRSVTELAEHYHAVHRLVYAPSGNRVLVSLLDRLNDRAGRYRALFLPLQYDLDAVATVFHRKLTIAFRERDGDRLAELIHAHLVDAMNGFTRGERFWQELSDEGRARRSMAG